MAGRKKILLFADWYEPGYRAGGPIRSCVNFATHMQGDYEVYVFTSDRDLDANDPYPGIDADKWIEGKDGARIYYCSPGNLGWSTILRQLQSVAPDFVYLNSMFSGKFTLLPLLATRLRRLPCRIILSPRGMLRSSAIQFKSAKKKLFLRSFRALGFSRHIEFLASDETELHDVHRYFGTGTKVRLIPNFPAGLPPEPDTARKEKGTLSLIYIGRIHPIKNTHLLLEILGKVPSTTRLTIVGSVEDKEYWHKCQDIIAGLPAHVSVTYAGELPNHALPAITGDHHIFVLPTQGENFGHAIYEALILGKPVLISDQTPWRNLGPARAGWDLPLQQPEAFGLAIEQAAGFDQQQYDEWCKGARAYVRAFLDRSNIKEEYLKLFH